MHNLKPHPFVFELSPHNIPNNNDGCDLRPFSPIIGNNGWGDPIRKVQVVHPSLSIASENLIPKPPACPDVIVSYHDIPSSPEQNYHPLVPT